MTSLAWPDSPAYSDLTPAPESPAPAPPASKFTPEVERYRPLVQSTMPDSIRARPDAQQLVDKYLYTMEGESGGRQVPHDGGAGWGLMADRVERTPVGSSEETQLRNAWKLIEKNPDVWTDYGEGTQYEGRNFGALGAPSAYTKGGTGAGSGGSGAEGSSAGAAVGRIASGNASLKLRPASTSEVSPSDYGLDEQSSTAPLSLRAKLNRQTPEQDPSADTDGLLGIGKGIVGAALNNPVTRAYNDVNVDIPVVTPAINKYLKPAVKAGVDYGPLAPVVAPLNAGLKAAGAPQVPSFYGAAASGIKALGGPSLPTPGDIAASMVPSKSADVALAALPLAGKTGEVLTGLSPELRAGEAAYGAGISSGGNLERQVAGQVARDAAEAPLTGIERQLQESLNGAKPAIESKSPAEMKQAMQQAGIATDHLSSVSQIVNRYRQFASESSALGTPIDNVSNVARETYTATLERTGSAETATQAARKAAAQENTANARAGELSLLMDTPVKAVAIPASEHAAQVEALIAGAEEMPLSQLAKEAATHGVDTATLTTRQQIVNALKDVWEKIKSLVQGAIPEAGPGDMQAGFGGRQPNWVNEAKSYKFEPEELGNVPKQEVPPVQPGLSLDAPIQPNIDMAKPTSGPIPSNTLSGSGYQPLQEKSLNGFVKSLLSLPSVSKQIQVSGDVGSASVRQALPVAFQSPGIAAKNFARGVRAYAESPLDTTVMDEIGNLPRFKPNDPHLSIQVIGADGKPNLIKVRPMTEVLGIGKDFVTPGFEQANSSPLQRWVTEHYPLLARSEKAQRAIIVGNATDLRNGMIESAARAGITDPSWYHYYDGLAKVATGYGDVPKSLQAIQSNFYSLRNIAARFQTMTKPFTSPGPVFAVQDDLAKTQGIFSASPRGVATRQLVRFGAGELANLRLLAAAGKMSGNFEVGYNPLEPGFGKLDKQDEQGNHYSTDLLGGYGSLIKAMARTAAYANDVAAGKADQSKYDPPVDWANYARYKMSGLPSTIIDTTIAHSGFQNVPGLKSPFAIDLADPKTWTEGKFVSLGVPFFTQDAIQGLISGDLTPTPDGLTKAAGLTMAQWAGFPTSLYPPNGSDLQDLAARRGVMVDGQLVRAATYDQIGPAAQRLIDTTDPAVAKYKAENPSDYAKAKEADYAKNRDIQNAIHGEEAFNNGVLLDAPVGDLFSKANIAKGAISDSLSTQFEKMFANFDRTRFDAVKKGYYDTKVDNLSNSGLNQEATESARMDYFNKLKPDEQQWLNEALQVTRENKTPLEKERLDYIDAKKAKGYFDPKADSKKLDAANPDLDFKGWKFNGGYKNGDGIEVSPPLNSEAALNKALADPLSKSRQVKLAGLDRPINQDEKSRSAWEYSKEPILWYLNDLVPQNAAAEGAQLAKDKKDPEYAKPFDQMDTAHRGTISRNLHNAAQKRSPELDAWLYWWGSGETLGSQQAANIVADLFQTYGDKPPK